MQLWNFSLVLYSILGPAALEFLLVPYLALSLFLVSSVKPQHERQSRPGDKIVNLEPPPPLQGGIGNRPRPGGRPDSLGTTATPKKTKACDSDSWGRLSELLALFSKGCTFSLIKFAFSCLLFVALFKNLIPSSKNGFYASLRPPKAQPQVLPTVLSRAR